MGMSPGSLVSVIIPTYNRAPLLAAAIESAIGQTYAHKEIIVVDDGSTDNTPELVARYPQVIYLYQPNGGQGKARNTGLAVARGVYIASLDSDDVWAPDFLAHCIGQLESSTAGFVFTNWTQEVEGSSYDFLEKTQLLAGYVNAGAAGWITFSNQQLRNLYLTACPSPSSSFVFRRTAMVGNWNEQMHIADDWCLLLDMILLQSCTAAVHMDRRWTKRRDGQNICDGRNFTELMEYLNINDNTAILERYRPVLLPAEIAHLNRLISGYIYRLYVHNLLHRCRSPKDGILLKRALRAHPFLLVSMAARSVYGRARRGLNKAGRALSGLSGRCTGKFHRAGFGLRQTAD